MVSISMSAVLLAAIVLFASLSIVALGGGLVLKTMLNSTEKSDTHLLNHSVKKTFITSLIVALLLVYYYLSTTAWSCIFLPIKQKRHRNKIYSGVNLMRFILN